MDIQRSILIVALAVVSYLMVLQWNEDYGQAALPAEVSTSTAATPALPDTPAATANTGGDDIPTAVAEPSAAAVAPTAPEAPPVKSKPAAQAEVPAAKHAAEPAVATGSAKMTLASVSSKPAVVAPKPAHRSNAVLNDSQIAGIKKRLALTPEQERYWPAVEAELRKMEYSKKSSQGGSRMASIDTSKMDVEGLKSAGFPLVMSFSDDQRRELKSLAHLLGLESVMAGL